VAELQLQPGLQKVAASFEYGYYACRHWAYHIVVGVATSMLCLLSCRGACYVILVVAASTLGRHQELVTGKEMGLL